MRGLNKFFKKNPGQIATLLVLLIAVTLLFTIFTINIGLVSQKKTVISNAADSAALYLASALSSYSYMLQQNLGFDPGEFSQCDYMLLWVVLDTSDFWSFMGSYFTFWLMVAVAIVAGIPTFGIGSGVYLAAYSYQYYTWVEDLQEAASDINKLAPKIALVLQTQQVALFQMIDDKTTIPDIFDTDEDGDKTEQVPAFVATWLHHTQALGTKLKTELQDIIDALKSAIDAYLNYLEGIGWAKGYFMLMSEFYSYTYTTSDFLTLIVNLDSLGYHAYALDCIKGPGGNCTPLLDENNNPVVDGAGNPIYAKTIDGFNKLLNDEINIHKPNNANPGSVSNFKYILQQAQQGIDDYSPEILENLLNTVLATESEIIKKGLSEENPSAPTGQGFLSHCLTNLNELYAEINEDIASEDIDCTEENPPSICTLRIQLLEAIEKWGKFKDDTVVFKIFHDNLVTAIKDLIKFINDLVKGTMTYTYWWPRTGESIKHIVQVGVEVNTNDVEGNYKLATVGGPECTDWDVKIGCIGCMETWMNDYKGNVRVTVRRFDVDAPSKGKLPWTLTAHKPTGSLLEDPSTIITEVMDEWPWYVKYQSGDGQSGGNNPVSVIFDNYGITSSIKMNYHANIGGNTVDWDTYEKWKATDVE